MGGSHASGGARATVLGLLGVGALAGAGLGAAAPGAVFLLLAAGGGFALGAAAVLRRRPAVPAPGPPPVDQGPAGRSPAGGRATVAALAHDLSNSIATLTCNLEWLREALDRGRLDAPEEQAEARAVLHDALEATERLRAGVGVLRAAGRGEGTPPVR